MAHRRLTIDPPGQRPLGDYTVEVIVDGCRSTSAPYTLTVFESVSAAPEYSYTLAPDCSPRDLRLSAKPAGGDATYRYAWTGPNGFTSTVADPTIASVTPANNGSYAVTVTDGKGCSTTASVEVRDIAQARAKPVIASSGPACEGGTIVLDIPAYTGSSVTYAWTTPANTTANVTGLGTNRLTITPVSASTHAGDYAVTVTVDGCVLTSAPFDVKVFGQPTAAPIVTTPSICTGETLRLDAGATSASTYVWSGPNGFTSASATPVIANATTAANGTYTVTASNASGCKTAATVTVDAVRPAPVQPTVTTNAPVCRDAQINLTVAENYVGNAVAYRWLNANGTEIGTMRSITFAANATTAVAPYRVEVTVDGCTAPSSAPTPVQVDEVPVAVASNSGPVCAGQSVTLFAGQITGARYEWRTGGTLVSTDRSYIVSAINASMTYTLTVLNGTCTSASATTTVTVNPAPAATPDFAYSAASDCALTDLTLRANPTGAAATTAGYTYRWTGPNNFTSTERNPVLRAATPSANGSYTVVITDGSSAACAKTFTVEVSGVVAPVAMPVIAASGVECEGGVVTLSIPAYAGADVTYAWSTPAGTTQDITGANTNVLRIATSRAAVHAGDYGVTVIVNGCLASADPYTLSITPKPTVAPSQNYTLASDCSVTGFDLMANATGTAPLTYAWTGPSGFTSTAASPRIDRATAAANGSYSVTATDANGCTTTGIVQVRGIQEPLAKPQVASTGDACAGGNITLSVAGYAGSNVSYAWSVPASATSGVTGANTRQLVISPATAAQHNGSYRVTVTVDGCTVSADPFAVNVYALPTAAPSATAGIICNGGELQFAANAGDATGYAWTGPNGFTSTAQNPTISGATAAANGTYVLKVTSVEGCTATAMVDVTSVRPALAQPSVSSKGPVCEGSTIELRTDYPSVSGRSYVYSWTDANGAVIGMTRFINTPSSTPQPFRLTITEDACQAPVSEAFFVRVDQIPVASASNSGPICFGESSTLTAGNVDNASYTWRVQGSTGVLSTDRTVSVKPSATTTYELTVQRGTCASVTATTTLVVNTPNLIAAQANYTLRPDCSASDLGLSYSITTAGSGAIASQRWTGPNGFTSTLASPTITGATAAANGSYQVTATDVNGCTSSASVQVTNAANAQPAPQITSSGPACLGQTVTLSVPSYSGSNVTYVWTLPASATRGVSGQGTPKLGLTPVEPTVHAGDYSLTVTVDGCTLTSQPVAVQVFSQPTTVPGVVVTNACAEGSFQLEARSTNASTYAWTGPTGFTSTLPNPIVTPATIRNNGSYFLTVTSVSGCTATGSVRRDADPPRGGGADHYCTECVRRRTAPLLDERQRREVRVDRPERRLRIDARQGWHDDHDRRDHACARQRKLPVR